MATILIADDYDDNREVLRLMLEAAGHEIREARDGRECLTMALEQPPDILLVDLSMPVLDGRDVVRQIRDNERTRLIPCVAVSAFPAPYGTSASDGFNAYISKPFRTTDLISTVASLLAERSFD